MQADMLKQYSGSSEGDLMQTMSAGIRWWFESLDRSRRERGATMDRLGYGPQESPFQAILATPGMRLRYYGGPSGNAAVALIIPAPIKRHYIWDLAPQCSVVQRLLDRNMHVYLVEWADPAGAENGFGLQEYGYALIDRCVAAIRAIHPSGQLFLFSHSLGGVFAAIYAALCPDRVAGLVLIETPLHLGKASGSFGPLVAFGPHADKVTEVFDRVPGSVLNLASVIASPATFNVERYADLMASLGSSKWIKSHFLVERWTLDEAPMAGRLFEQVVECLYREDSFMRGTLTVDGKRLSPKDVVSPLLSVYDPHSVIITPASVIAFHEAAGSSVKRLLSYGGDTGVALLHVGALIGENAHRLLWPRIFDWIGEAGAPRH